MYLFSFSSSFPSNFHHCSCPSKLFQVRSILLSFFVPHHRPRPPDDDNDIDALSLLPAVGLPLLLTSYALHPSTRPFSAKTPIRNPDLATMTTSYIFLDCSFPRIYPCPSYRPPHPLLGNQVISKACFRTIPEADRARTQSSFPFCEINHGSRRLTGWQARDHPSRKTADAHH